MWNSTHFGAPQIESESTGLAQWLAVAAATLLSEPSSDWVWNALPPVEETLSAMSSRALEGPLHHLVALYSNAVQELIAFFHDGLVEHLQTVLKTAFEAHRETRRLTPPRTLPQRRLQPMALGRPMRLPGTLTGNSFVLA